VVIAIFRNFIVIQGKGNKKQIFAMKYQVWASASLQNVRTTIAPILFFEKDFLKQDTQASIHETLSHF